MAIIVVIRGRFKEISDDSVYGYYLVRRNEVVYVGVTKRPEARAKNHETVALIDRNPGLKNNGIRKAARLGYQIELKLKRRFDSVEEAYLWEIAQIARLKRRHEGGVLWNRTAGGEGGIDPSPETRKKKSEASKRMHQEIDHPFQGGELQREMHRRKFEEGTHHLLDPRRLKAFGGLNQKRLEEGVHNFQDPSFYERRREKLKDYHQSDEFRNAVSQNVKVTMAKKNIPKVVAAAKIVLNWKSKRKVEISRQELRQTGIAPGTYKDYGLRFSNAQTNLEDVLHCLKARYDKYKEVLDGYPTA